MQPTQLPPLGSPNRQVIVTGNEKGGSGKSTTAVHLAVALATEGYRVATLDLDARQGTLTRYLENRAAFVERTGIDLPVPTVDAPDLPVDGDADDLEAAVVDRVARLRETADIVLVDTPGSAGPITTAGHTQADILVTPINDSFIDLDLLARVDPDTLKVIRPSRYAETVWALRQARARQGLPAVDWIVVRNRLSALDPRNKRDVGAVLAQLEKRLAFRQAPGFGERVIFRELFLKGLTLLDLRAVGMEGGLSMSHVAARQELRSLLKAIGLATEPAAAAAPTVETASVESHGTADRGPQPVGGGGRSLAQHLGRRFFGGRVSERGTTES